MSHRINPKTYFSGAIIICSILGFFSDTYALSRQEVIAQTLDKQERPHQQRPYIEDTGRQMYLGSPRGIERKFVIEKTLDKLEFALAIGLGYLNGDTRYEINFNESGHSGRSELVFPFDNWLAGGNILLGRYPFYLNLQGWTNIAEKKNTGMTDKDWTDGYLVSSTESDNEAKIAILDVNLLYNLWQGDKPWGDVAKGFKKGRFGLLAGYRYENFKYDIIGYKNLFTDISYYPGREVLDYEIKYHIPYIGLNWQYFNDLTDKTLDRWGVNVQVCGSPYVIAKDRDYHLLRNKMVEGRAKGYAFLVGLNTFFETRNNLIWKLGFDYSGIRTEGKQNQLWYGDDPGTIGDDTGDSIEGINLRLESSQCLFWGLLQYNF